MSPPRSNSVAFCRGRICQTAAGCVWNQVQMASGTLIVRSTGAGNNPIELPEPCVVRVLGEVGATRLGNQLKMLLRGVIPRVQAEGLQCVETPLLSVQFEAGLINKLAVAWIQTDRSNE